MRLIIDIILLLVHFLVILMELLILRLLVMVECSVVMVKIIVSNYGILDRCVDQQQQNNRQTEPFIQIIGMQILRSMKIILTF